MGITRAKERLFLTNAERRRIYGQEMYNPPSEFIDDIPRELMSYGVDELKSREIEYGNNNKSLTPKLTNSLTPFSVGSKVIHPQFGNGIILQREGRGENSKLTIFFRNAGKKKLALKYTHLKSE